MLVARREPELEVVPRLVPQVRLRRHAVLHDRHQARGGFGRGDEPRARVERGDAKRRRARAPARAHRRVVHDVEEAVRGLGVPPVAHALHVRVAVQERERVLEVNHVRVGQEHRAPALDEFANDAEFLRRNLVRTASGFAERAPVTRDALRANRGVQSVVQRDHHEVRNLQSDDALDELVDPGGLAVGDRREDLPGIRSDGAKRRAERRVPVAIHGPSRVVPRAGVARGDAIERAGGREAEKPRLRDAPAERRERVGVAQVQRAAFVILILREEIEILRARIVVPVPPRAAFNIFGDDHDASGRVLLGRRSRLALERVALRGERAGVPGRVAAARRAPGGNEGVRVVAGREVVAMRRQRGVRAPDERAGEHRTPEPRAAEEAHGARRGSSAPGSGSLRPRRAKEALRGADRPLRGVDEKIERRSREVVLAGARVDADEARALGEPDERAEEHRLRDHRAEGRGGGPCKERRSGRAARGEVPREGRGGRPRSKSADQSWMMHHSTVLARRHDLLVRFSSLARVGFSSFESVPHAPPPSSFPKHWPHTGGLPPSTGRNGTRHASRHREHGPSCTRAPRLLAVSLVSPVSNHPSRVEKGAFARSGGVSSCSRLEFPDAAPPSEAPRRSEVVAPPRGAGGTRRPAEE